MRQSKMCCGLWRRQFLGLQSGACRSCCDKTRAIGAEMQRLKADPAYIDSVLMMVLPRARAP